MANEKPRIRLAHKTIFMGMLYFWKGYECFGAGECGWGDTPRAAYDAWLIQATGPRWKQGQVVEQHPYAPKPDLWGRIKRDWVL